MILVLFTSSFVVNRVLLLFLSEQRSRRRQRMGWRWERGQIRRRWGGVRQHGCCGGRWSRGLPHPHGTLRDTIICLTQCCMALVQRLRAHFETGHFTETRTESRHAQREVVSTDKSLLTTAFGNRQKRTGFKKQKKQKWRICKYLLASLGFDLFLSLDAYENKIETYLTLLLNPSNSDMEDVRGCCRVWWWQGSVNDIIS